jgi:methylenetetrahydrofolate reductase (NADPH)
MRIRDMIARCGQFVSLEFFPPKETSKLAEFFGVAERLKAVKPLFVSVTYGAGGATQDNTLELVRRLKRELEYEPMAHLTCVGATAPHIKKFLGELDKADVDNVLALRGDPPKGETSFKASNKHFRYASDLVAFIRKNFPRMGVAVAGYPEKHPEAPSLEEDCEQLKRKVELGGDFVITQLFFDNAHYFRYVERLRALGVTAPVIPGVLPILSLSVIKRILSLCGASIPESFLLALEEADLRSGDEVRKLGVDHARRQVRELLEQGAPGVHLYTLNKADACLEILKDQRVCRNLDLG